MAHRKVQPRTEIGKRLEKELANRGLNRETGPAEIGVSKPTYLGWLRGQMPDFESVHMIAKFLEVEITTVFEWIESDRAKGLYRESASGKIRSPLPELQAA